MHIRENHDVLTQLQQWQCPVDMENVFDLESFLRAILFLPQSITSDFNLPQWGYFVKSRNPAPKISAEFLDTLTLH